MSEVDALGLSLEPVKSNGGRPPKKLNGRQRKLECPECGFICYASAGAIKRAGLPLCACGAQLALPNLRDLLAVGDAQALEHVEAGEALERAAKRDTASAESGFRRGACNCASCGKFKSRPADVCDYCGDEPATYGPDMRREREVHNRGAGYRA